MNHPTLALCSCLLLAACATTRNGGAEAPELEKQVAPENPAPRVPVLTLAPELSPLSLTCRKSELAQPNALDDDCDGSIDQLPQSAELTLAWATAGEGEVAVEVLDGQSASVAPSDAQASACNQSGASSAYARFDRVPQGEHKLVLRHVRACAEPKPLTVVLSTRANAQTRSYLVTLAPGQTLPLGTLTLR